MLTQSSLKETIVWFFKKRQYSYDQWSGSSKVGLLTNETNIAHLSFIVARLPRLCHRENLNISVARIANTNVCLRHSLIIAVAVPQFPMRRRLACSITAASFHVTWQINALLRDELHCSANVGVGCLREVRGGVVPPTRHTGRPTSLNPER